MGHMNYKIQTLLQEGVSISTLENLTSDQINVLYERAKKSKKKETKEMINVKAGSPEEKELQSKGKSYNTYGGEVTEKATSKKQQKAMGIALSAKRGDIPKSELKGASKEMVKMSEKNLKDFASTKHKGLPEKKKSESKENVKKLEESIMKLIESHLNPTTTKGDLLKTIKKFKR
jgi:hypothetical protein